MLCSAISFAALTPENLDQHIANFKEAKLDRFFIGIVEPLWEGEERKEKFEWAKTVLNRIRESGMEAGIWCGGLGYGPPHGEEYNKRFSNPLTIEGFNGRKNFANCVLDQDFRKEYLKWIQEYVRTGADMLLIDDDFVLSARNVMGCACKEHLKLLSARAGYQVTHEDLVKAFTGKPNALRTMFIDLQGETVMEFCRDIRRAADSVDPGFRIGLCASYTHFDLEGVDLKKMLYLLAGKGNQPYLRLSGATYWNLRASRLHPGRQSIGAIQETVRSQRAYLQNSGIEMTDENDTHPRDHRILPSSLCELYDRITIADGADGRHKYMFQYFYCSSLTVTGKSYLRAHLRNQPFEKELFEMFRGGYADGWLIKQEQQVMRQAVLPDEFAGDDQLMSWGTQSRAGAFLTMQSQTTSYESGCGGPVAAFWENARYLTGEEFDRGVLLDITAAMKLADMGVDVGLQGVEEVADPTGETFYPDGTRYNMLMEPEGKFYRVSLAPGAEVLSTFHSADGDYPACYFYKNAKGQRFAVYTFDSNTLHYMVGLRFGVLFSPGRRAQLNEIYSRLSGKVAPISALNDVSQDFYMLARRNGRGNLAVMFCNIFPDPADMLEFKLAVPGKIVKVVNGSAAICNGTKLEVGDIAPYGWCAVEIADL